METQNVYIFDVDAIHGSLTSTVKDKVTEHNGGDVILLTAFGDNLSMKEQCLRLYRQHNLHRNQRETVLSSDDQLISIQLCLAQLNKQAIGDYDADVSDVILMKRKLTELLFGTSNPEESEELSPFLKEYDSFLKTNNVTDWPSVCLRVEEALRSEKLKRDDTSCLFIGSPQGKIESHILKTLSDGKRVFRVKVELPLDLSFTGVASSAEVLIEEGSLSEMTSEEVSSPLVRPDSISELYIERVFVDYVHLLLNSKSEISLGRVINVPDRSLNHVAFTHLKHESQKRGMSMFQTAVSYVMRLRLGGKSYAPDPNCKLNRHVKGLSEFTDLMHKLSNVLEDELNPSVALKRIVNVLKNNILKGSCLNADCVRNVAEKMNVLLEKAVVTMQGMTFEATKEHATIIGLDSLRAMHVFLDTSYSGSPSTRVVDVLRDSFSSQNTPLRFPSLLSKFRSPLDDQTPTRKASLSERVLQRNKQPEKVMAVPRFKANNEWSRGEEKENSEGFISAPSICENSSDSWKRPPVKRIFESIDDQENVAVVTTTPALATPEQDEETQVVKEVASKKSKSLSLKEAKPKVKTGKVKPKAKVLLKGQRSLTSFFKN